MPRLAFGFDEPQPQVAAYTVIGSIAGLPGLSLPLSIDSTVGAIQIVGTDNRATLAIGRALAGRFAAIGAPSAFAS